MMGASSLRPRLLRTRMLRRGKDFKDGWWLFGVVCWGSPSGPALPLALTLALSRCCWVFWGRGDFAKRQGFPRSRGKCPKDKGGSRGDRRQFVARRIWWRFEP